MLLILLGFLGLGGFSLPAWGGEASGDESPHGGLLGIGVLQVGIAPIGVRVTETVDTGITFTVGSLDGEDSDDTIALLARYTVPLERFQVGVNLNFQFEDGRIRTSAEGQPFTLLALPQGDVRAARLAESQLQTEWSADALLRLGYALGDQGRWVSYVAGGYSMMQVGRTLSSGQVIKSLPPGVSNFMGPSPVPVRSEHLYHGWKVATGLEVALGPRLSLFGQVEYAEYAAQGYALLDILTGATFPLETTIQALGGKAGLLYKF